MAGERSLDVRGNKRRFYPVSSHSNKSSADEWADGFRGGGYLARVVPTAKGYNVIVNSDRATKGQKEITQELERKSYPGRTSVIFNKNNPANNSVVSMPPREIEYSASKMDEYENVRRFLLYVGTVHLVAALLMVIYANKDFIIGITSTFAAGPPGCIEAGTCEAFTITNYDVQLAYWVAAFSALSALFHYITVLPGFYESYRSELMKGRNPYRWVEYALSSTLMILIIMLISGITNLTALIGVGFANIGMILFGWISEIMNPPERDKTDWTAFWFGCIMGLGAWIALWGSLAINLEQLGVDWSAIPSFVWVIIATQFALFNVFAVNHALQFIPGFYSEGYLRGEKNYIWLSLISKSLLAWSIYINTLIL